METPCYPAFKSSYLSSCRTRLQYVPTTVLSNVAAINLQIGVCPVLWREAGEDFASVYFPLQKG